MNIQDRTKLPEFLYRYRSFKDENACQEIENIRRKTVYGSVFTKLNDPMEGAYAFYAECVQPPFSDTIKFIL